MNAVELLFRSVDITVGFRATLSFLRMKSVGPSFSVSVEEIVNQRIIR